MGAPTSSYATAGIALRVSGALKHHHHDKVETPSVGRDDNTRWNYERQAIKVRTGSVYFVSFCRKRFITVA
jgi:hypothetical protein